MTDLKPCPFCGLPPHHGTDFNWPSLGCTNRGCICVYVEGKTVDECITAWNRRTPSPAVQELVQAARNLVANNTYLANARVEVALAAVEKEITNG